MWSRLIACVYICLLNFTHFSGKCLSYILVMIFFSNFPQSVFGSIKRLAFSSDEMSITRNPSQSVFIIVSLIDLLRMYFSRFIPADTLRNNDVVVTSKRRHFDVITSKWRRFDVITTLLLRHVFRGIVFSDIPRLTIHDSIWRTKRTCVLLGVLENIWLVTESHHHHHHHHYHHHYHHHHKHRHHHHYHYLMTIAIIIVIIILIIILSVLLLSWS